MSTATIQLRAESRQIRTATDDLRALERQGSATDRTAQILTRTLGALGAALSVREVIGYADAYTNVQNSLRLVTSSTEQLITVQQEVLNIANQTRSDLGATAELYSTLARNTESLGLSQDRLLRVTELVNKSFAVSGADANTASGAIRQLSQALAAGALRGDEFNSVAEGAPEIMRAIRQETGMTAGELREFAATGQITAELLIKSLENYGAELDATFDKAERTFGQSLTVARNNAIEFTGSLESSAGVVGALGDGIVLLSESLNTLATVGGVVAAVYSARLLGSIGAATSATIASIAASRAAAVSYDALGVAVTRASVAMSAGAVAARGLGAAITLIGGPLGFIALTGAAVAYTIYDMRKAQDEFAEATSRSTTAIQAQNSVLDIYQQKTRTAAQESLKGLGVNELNAEFDKANSLIAIYTKRLEDLTSRGASAQRIADVNEKLRLQRERVDAIKEALPGVIGLSAQQQQALEKVTTSLTDQIYELEKGRDAYELLIATRQAGVALDSAEAAGLQSLINQRNQLRQGIEAEAKAREEAQRIEREAQSRVDSLRQGIGRDIQSGMSPLRQLEAELYERQQIIERFRQDGTLNTANADQLELDALVAFNLRKNEIEQQAAEERRRIRENEESLRRQQMMTTLSATESLFGNLADIAKEGGRKSFENYKILASAQAGVSGVMAFMNALATPAPFPIPQILAGTIAAVTAAQIAKLNSMQYSGARRQGGQVTRGNSYLVGEQGPEMITMGGNGRVTPFNQLMQKAESGGGGNSQVNLMVNISKQEGAQDSVTGRQVQDKYILDVVVGSMDSRGAVFNSVVRNTTAQGRTR